jgi:hypothetical protein
MRFIGSRTELAQIWDEIMEQFPEADLPSEDTGDWYTVNDVMVDEYECRFEELPEEELIAMDGSLLVEEFPEDFLTDLMERYERVYGVFKWASMDVGVGCGDASAERPRGIAVVEHGEGKNQHVRQRGLKQGDRATGHREYRSIHCLHRPFPPHRLAAAGRLPQAYRPSAR